MFEEDVIPRVDQEDFKTSGSFIYSYDLTFMLLTKVEDKQVELLESIRFSTGLTSWPI